MLKCMRVQARGLRDRGMVNKGPGIARFYRHMDRSHPAFWKPLHAPIAPVMKLRKRFEEIRGQAVRYWLKFTASSDTPPVSHQTCA